jgi:hypothetical protein
LFISPSLDYPEFSTATILLSWVYKSKPSNLNSQKTLVSTVSTQTIKGINLENLKDVVNSENQDKTNFLNLCCGTYLLNKESNGERYLKTVRMKKSHLDSAHVLTTRQIIDQLLAKNIKWAEF